MSEVPLTKNIPVRTAEVQFSLFLRRAVDVTRRNRAREGSCKPGKPRCDGILLWEARNRARVNLAGGILIGQKERVLARREAQIAN